MRLLLFLYLLLIVKGIKTQELPIYKTKEEKEFEKRYILPKVKVITNPPSSPVRNAAEWEEMQGVLISWKGYESFLKEIVRYAKEEVKVYIHCEDTNSVKSYLLQNNITLENVKFIKANMNSVWIRDYGPNGVYVNDVDTLLFVDWVYNRPRPQDDVSPQYIANLLNVPLYGCIQPPTDLVHTGGNWMSDGFGTAFSSKLVLIENESINAYNQTPKTEQDIDNIVKNFLGINRYIKMDVLPYDGIHHIDMHMKLLDEETLLVGEYPPGISDGPQIEENLNYVLNNFNSVFGTPYRVIRIPMPPSQSGLWPNQGAYYRTYTNSLIINKTVLVPTYYTKYDTTALRIYREALPGYRIIGINAESIIPAGGTIHCVTHEIPAFEPLLISHQPIRETNNIWEPYQINALIKHKTGIEEARIYYRTDTTQPYSYVPMNLTNQEDNIWTGYIPVQPNNSYVYYYIWAKANNGKEQVRPLPAPLAYWKFHVYNPTLSKEINNYTFYTFENYENGFLNILINSKNSLTTTIELFDLCGKKLALLYEGQIFQGTQELSYNIPELKGIYFISYNTNFGRITKKILLK